MVKAIHPGEHLAGELKAMGMSAAEFARQIEVPANRVTQLLKGQRAVTGDTALRMAIFLAPARNSGSTCKACTKSVWRSGAPEKLLGRFPR